MTATAAHYEYLIVGAGPAGLQLGYFLEKARRNYIILEAGATPGTFFTKFPRHRTLISINKVFTGFSDVEMNMRWDWNSLLSDDDSMLFKNYTERYFPKADDLVRYLGDFAAHFNLNVKCNVKVANIAKNGHFTVTDSENNSYTCDRLIIATGLSKMMKPDIPGIELAEMYSDVSVDPQDFRGQRVFIIGKGNSGFETADNLVETTSALHLASPTPVKLAWKTHFVGHVRAVNNNVLDTYQLKSQNTIIDANIKRIWKKEDKIIVSFEYTHANGQNLDVSVDRVIVCSGFRFDSSIFDESCKPALAINGKVPDMKSDWESSNIEGLYFAGALTQMRDFKKTFSAFIHGFRYNARALSQILDIKRNGGEWPSEPVSADPEVVLDTIMKRIHTNSALFQQPAFFCDALVFSDQDQAGRYYREMPIEYLHDSELGQSDHYYTITMEYGHEDYPDPFNITRIPDRGMASHFIHPVIRRFSGPNLVAEYHVPEDLENNWMQEMYLQPCLEFLTGELAAPA